MSDALAVALLAMALIVLLTLAIAVVKDRYGDLLEEPAPYTYSYEVDWPKEPWRDRHDAAHVATLPTWWLRSVANPGELAAAARHDYRIDGLRPSIDEIGIHTPLTVNIDQLGRVCLADGHHRLVTATQLDLTVCPVQFELVPRIGGYGVPVGRAVTALVLDQKQPALHEAHQMAL